VGSFCVLEGGEEMAEKEMTLEVLLDDEVKRMSADEALALVESRPGELVMLRYMPDGSVPIWPWDKETDEADEPT
jgi:hypothetical protein